MEDLSTKDKGVLRPTMLTAIIQWSILPYLVIITKNDINLIYSIKIILLTFNFYFIYTFL